MNISTSKSRQSYPGGDDAGPRQKSIITTSNQQRFAQEDQNQRTPQQTPSLPVKTRVLVSKADGSPSGSPSHIEPQFGQDHGRSGPVKRVIKVSELPQTSNVSLQQQHSMLNQLEIKSSSHRSQQSQADQSAPIRYEPQQFQQHSSFQNHKGFGNATSGQSSPSPHSHTSHTSSKIAIVKAADVQAAAAAGNKFAVVLKSGNVVGTNKGPQEDRNAHNSGSQKRSILVPSANLDPDQEFKPAVRQITISRSQQDGIEEQGARDGKKVIQIKPKLPTENETKIPPTVPDLPKPTDTAVNITLKPKPQSTLMDDIDVSVGGQKGEKTNKNNKPKGKNDPKPSNPAPVTAQPPQPTNSRYETQPTSKKPNQQSAQTNQNKTNHDDDVFTPPTSILPSLTNSLRSRTVGTIKLHEAIPTNLLPHVTEDIYRHLFHHFVVFCERNQCEVIATKENYRIGEVDYESYTAKKIGVMERLKFEFAKSIKSDFSTLTPKLFKSHSIFTSKDTLGARGSTNVSITTSANKMFNYPSVLQLEQALSSLITATPCLSGSVYYSLLAFTRALPSFHERNALHDQDYWAHLTLFKKCPRDYPHPFLYIPAKIKHQVYPGLGCIRTQASIKAATQKNKDGKSLAPKPIKMAYHIDPSALDIVGTPYKPDFSSSTLLDPFWWARGLDYVEKQKEKVFYERELAKFSAKKKLSGFAIHTPDSPLYKQQQQQLTNEMYQQSDFNGYKHVSLAERIRELVKPDLKLNRNLTFNAKNQLVNATTGVLYVPVTQRGYVHGYSDPRGFAGSNGSGVSELHKRRWTVAWENSKTMVSAFQLSLTQSAPVASTASSLMASLAQSSALSGALGTPGLGIGSGAGQGGAQSVNPLSTPMLLVYARTNRLIDQVKILTALPDVTDAISKETGQDEDIADPEGTRRSFMIEQRLNLLNNINLMTRTFSTDQVYSHNSPYVSANGINTHPLIAMSHPDLQSTATVLTHITGANNKEAMRDIVREIEAVQKQISALEVELAPKPNNRTATTTTASATTNQKSAPSTQSKLSSLTALKTRLDLLNSKFSFMKTTAQTNLYSILVPQPLQMSQNSILFSSYPEIATALSVPRNLYYLPYHPKRNVITTGGVNSNPIPRTKVPVEDFFASLKITTQRLPQTQKSSNLGQNSQNLQNYSMIDSESLLKPLPSGLLTDLDTIDTLIDFLLTTPTFRIAIPSCPAYFGLHQYIDDYSTFCNSPSLPSPSLTLSHRLLASISPQHLVNYGVSPLTATEVCFDGNWTQNNNSGVIFNPADNSSHIISTDLITLPPGTNTYGNYTSYTRKIVDLAAVVPVLPLLTHSKFLKWLHLNSEHQDELGITMNIKSLYYFFKSGHSLDFSRSKLVPVVQSKGDQEDGMGDGQDEEQEQSGQNQKNSKQSQETDTATTKYEYHESTEVISELPFAKLYPWSEAAIDFDKMVLQTSADQEHYADRLLHIENGTNTTDWDPEGDEEYLAHQERAGYYQPIDRTSWPGVFVHVFPEFYNLCQPLLDWQDAQAALAADEVQEQDDYHDSGNGNGNGYDNETRMGGRGGDKNQRETRGGNNDRNMYSSYDNRDSRGDGRDSRRDDGRRDRNDREDRRGQSSQSSRAFDRDSSSSHQSSSVGNQSAGGRSNPRDTRGGKSAGGKDQTMVNSNNNNNSTFSKSSSSTTSNNANNNNNDQVGFDDGSNDYNHNDNYSGYNNYNNNNYNNNNQNNNNNNQNNAGYGSRSNQPQGYNNNQNNNNNNNNNPSSYYNGYNNPSGGWSNNNNNNFSNPPRSGSRYRNQTANTGNYSGPNSYNQSNNYNPNSYNQNNNYNPNMANNNNNNNKRQSYNTGTDTMTSPNKDGQDGRYRDRSYGQGTVNNNNNMGMGNTNAANTGSNDQDGQRSGGSKFPRTNNPSSRRNQGSNNYNNNATNNYNNNNNNNYNTNSTNNHNNYNTNTGNGSDNGSGSTNHTNNNVNNTDDSSKNNNNNHSDHTTDSAGDNVGVDSGVSSFNNSATSFNPPVKGGNLYF